MTFDQLMSKVLEIMPSAEFEERDGQIIIYTNFQYNEDGTISLLPLES